MKDYEIPILYYNSGKEDKEALHLIREHKIPCYLRSPAEEPTPGLHVRFERYTGLNEIKEFIEEWETEKEQKD